MTLSSWIVETGFKNVAHALGVERATVSMWKTRDVLPRPYHMVQIHKLSKGKVSYKEMVETSARRDLTK